MDKLFSKMDLAELVQKCNSLGMYSDGDKECLMNRLVSYHNDDPMSRTSFEKFTDTKIQNDCLSFKIGSTGPRSTLIEKLIWYYGDKKKFDDQYETENGFTDSMGTIENENIFETLVSNVKELGIVFLILHFKIEIQTYYAYDKERVYQIRHCYNDCYGICYCNQLTEKFIRYWADSIDWRSISGKQKMSIPFLKEFETRVHWSTLAAFNYKTLTSDMITTFKHRLRLDSLDWQYISNEATLTYDFIKEFDAFIDWRSLSEFRSIEPQFLRDFHDKINWRTFSRNYWSVTPDVIIEFRRLIYLDEIDWYSISGSDLDVEFVREFRDNIDWAVLSRQRMLVPEFALEFEDMIDWELISRNIMSGAGLTYDLIKQFSHKMNWDIISQHVVLSSRFIITFRNKLNWKMLSGWNFSLTIDHALEYKDQIYWDDLCSFNTGILLNDIATSGLYVNWTAICKNRALPLTFIEKYKKEMDWKTFSAWNKHISIGVIERYSDLIDWNDYSLFNPAITSIILRNFFDYLVPELLSRNFWFISSLRFSTEWCTEHLMNRFGFVLESLNTNTDGSGSFVVKYKEGDTMKKIFF